jgi:hypothetical protein
MNKQAWQSPALTNYGSAATLTQQINFNKTGGTGDTILFIIPGSSPVTVPVPGGPISSITVNGNLVS